MNKTAIVASTISCLLALYYFLKPALPQRLRYWLRRVLARWTLAGNSDWPIKPGTETPSSNWPGWPQGQQFAFVLTHDVEGKTGLERCRQLMEIENRLGFKSSFNFVPEGEYRVPDDLREDLVRRGFEVGVHDLYHDGSLFRSQHTFAAQADGINSYLAKWDAAGFRAGFMFHNLNWLRRLNAKYDASTFDVDPFEPQPGGIHTIFPFWVEGRDGLEGYVELPYTLAQDSTLFLLLRERTIDIWKRKLDWVASHGGMALLDSHPDYMDFKGGEVKWNQYPASLYAEFLDYVRTKYQGMYWHALPREVADYCGQFKPCPAKQVAGSPSGRMLLSPLNPVGQTAPVGALSGKRAAVVVFSHYPSDPRPRRAAEALVQQGMEVDVICHMQDDDEPRRETFNGVNITRLPLRRRRGGRFTYVSQYFRFILSAFFTLTMRSIRRRYSLVHVHNMPDVLVFSALVPKLLGARVVLDLHDPMPELMMTIFGLKEGSRAVRLLKRLEKLSIWFADSVLTVNLACKKIFTARSCAAEKLSVVMNSPDESIFKYRDVAPGDFTQRDSAKPFVMMYHGSIVERHGLDLAVEALEIVRKSVPNAVLRIYGGSTSFLEQVMKTVAALGLQDAVQSFGNKNLNQIAAAIDECDVGVIPNRRSIFTEINTPTRIFEYLARGKAVIAPDSGGITDYFGRDTLVLFELGNAKDLARAMLFVHSQPVQVGEIVKRGQAVYRAHRWVQERGVLVDLVTKLVGAEKKRGIHSTSPVERAAAVE